MERTKKRERSLAQLANEISAETGIELDYCLQSTTVAEDAFQILLDGWLQSGIIIKDHVYADTQAALAEAAERTITLPRDQDGVPLFRVRYAAERVFYGLLDDSGKTDYESAAKGQRLRIIPHYDRMEQVIEQLVALQRQNEYPYNLPNAEVPNRSEFMPDEEVLQRGTREHALYLWHACYWMGGGIESNLAFKALTELYTDYPELFDPAFLVEHGISEQQVEEVVSKYPALNFNLQRIKRYWTTNARRLYDNYGSDPRNIFSDNPSYRTIKQRLINKRGNGFLGFQEKMASMYTHFLGDAGIIPETPFPPAVDFHLLRLAIANGILTFENVPENGNVFTPATIGTLRKMLYDYIIATGASELEVDDALWRYSKLMCAEAPGNATVVDYKAGRGVKSSAQEVMFSDPTMLAKYARSCGSCAIEATCMFNIASGPYYADDRIIPTPRIRLADGHDALIGVESSMLSVPPTKPAKPQARPGGTFLHTTLF